MQPLPKPSIIYDVLHQRTHHTYDDNNHPDLFLSPNDPLFTNTEYWMYSDLNSLYGDMRLDMKNMYPNTYYTMQNAISPTAHPDMAFHELFVHHAATIKTTYQPSPVAPYPQHRGITVTDMKLSRLAAWSLMRQRPSMMFARMFFLFPDATYSDTLNETMRFSRIHLRRECAHLERIVSGIVKQYGGDYRICNHLTHRSYFYGLDAAYIKSAHNLPDNPNVPLTDYLNAKALSIRNKSIQRAINEFNSTPIKNINTFHDILYKHLTDGRVELLRQTNRGPENCIERERVGKVETKLKKIERNFITQHISEKLH